MWRATEQEGIGLDSSLFAQQPTAEKTLHAPFHHRQRQSQVQHTERDGDRTQFATQNVRAQQPDAVTISTPGQPGESSLGLPQLDLDSITLSAALGINGDNMLSRLQRNPGEQSGHSPPELSAILAASLGFLPVSQ